MERIPMDEGCYNQSKVTTRDNLSKQLITVPYETNNCQVQLKGKFCENSQTIERFRGNNFHKSSLLINF